MTEQVNINIKYEGYITRQIKQVDHFKKLEKKKIPENFNYDEVPSLRIEARQKLKLYQPISIGQASRISGVSPADISVLLVYMEQMKYQGEVKKKPMEYNLDQFKKGLSDLNINLTEKQIEQFLKYYEILVETNKVMNLTAITEFDEVIEKHFLDSLSLVRVFDLNRNVKDIGSWYRGRISGYPT